MFRGLERWVRNSQRRQFTGTTKRGEQVPLYDTVAVKGGWHCYITNLEGYAVLASIPKENLNNEYEIQS
jgi:hypothetical protein